MVMRFKESSEKAYNPGGEPLVFRIVDEVDIDESLDSALRESLCVCFPKDVEIFSKVSFWRSVSSYRVLVQRLRPGYTAIIC